MLTSVAHILSALPSPIFTPRMQRSFLLNLALLLVLDLLVKPFYILGIDAGVQELGYLKR